MASSLCWGLSSMKDTNDINGGPFARREDARHGQLSTPSRVRPFRRSTGPAHALRRAGPHSCAAAAADTPCGMPSSRNRASRSQANGHRSGTRLPRDRRSASGFLRSEMVSTVAWLPSAKVSGSSSTTGTAGTWVRSEGAFGSDTRGRSAREGLARPARPSRSALCRWRRWATAQRRAIWLAERPSVKASWGAPPGRRTSSSGSWKAPYPAKARFWATRYRTSPFTTHKRWSASPSPCPQDWSETQ